VEKGALVVATLRQEDFLHSWDVHSVPTIRIDGAFMAESESDSLKLELERQRANTEAIRIDLDRARLKLDEYRATLEYSRIELERYRASNEAKKPSVDGLFKFAEMTVRSLLVLNGGSALAVLTFAGHSNDWDETGRMLEFGSLVTAFGTGAATAVLTAGLSYLSQLLMLEFEDSRIQCGIGGGLRCFAILSAFVSFVLFCSGIYMASHFFT